MNFQQLSAELAVYYGEREARNMVLWLAEDLFGISEPFAAKVALSDEEAHRLREIAKRLLHQEPLQYVLGKVNFYGYELAVSPSVLIPRPETEELVYNIVQQVRKMPALPLRWLEVGTGSGCIAIALKKQLPQIQITAIDISGSALQLARQNAQKNGVDIDFQQIDFLKIEDWAQHFTQPFDMLVSNPPYILRQEFEARMSENTIHEPAGALFVEGGDVQQFYRAFVDFAPFLSPSAWLWAELNEFVAEDTLELFGSSPHWQNAELLRDIRKAWRMIRAGRK